VLNLVRRYPVPVLFIGIFSVVSSVYTYALAPIGRQTMVSWTATNLVNLRSDPIGTLISSAFVAEEAPWIWIFIASVALFPLVRRFGNLRALVLVASAQVIGTLISEGILGLRIAMGQLPASHRFLDLDDVGPSYVIVCALVAVVLFGVGWKWRLAALGTFAALAPHLFEGLNQLDVTAVGHSVSILIGAAGGWYLVRAARRQPAVEQWSAEERALAAPALDEPALVEVPATATASRTG
jgi:hypothetical protein